jgi:hypothetical protein
MLFTLHKLYGIKWNMDNIVNGYWVRFLRGWQSFQNTVEADKNHESMRTAENRADFSSTRLVR